MAMVAPVVAPVVGGALLLTGCLKPAAIEADHAWVRLPAVEGRPGSGYFTLHGGAAATTLVAVSTDYAIRTEMHESMMSGGMATMAKIDSIPLPAGGEVTFQPGGRHLMLFGVSRDLKPGDNTLLTFTFADGSRIQRKAVAVGAGDPAPE
ncbi:copper chaperone PCu(A)C [Sphingomonas sp. BT553]|uniref:Copper chaperone PCu(A)C n=2 Tax=Sphingomonas mollis TaxID=2795726 RepID=A0ABS0XN99_9SPHN|nr:copper chaperone PCu(A)C [Sphingomonas sp. BT553]